MVLAISSTLRSRLLKAASATPDREVCGLLFGDDQMIEAVEPCRNVAVDPSRTFEIDPAALFAALRAERGGGRRLIGYWHSHPNGSTSPSATDVARAAADGKFWLIVADGRIDAWRADPCQDGIDGATRTIFSPVTLMET